MAWFWQAVSYCIFVPVFLLLALLLLPVPPVVRQYVVSLVKAVLFARLKVTGLEHGLPLIYVVLVVVGILFASSVRGAWSAEGVWAESNERGLRDSHLLLHKFREERNAWVAGFGFTLWVILWRVFSLMESVVAEQREVSALRAAAAPVSGGDDAAARKKN